MKVMVTGGTGVVGAASVTELRRRGHQVRLVSRNAHEDSAQWADSVESWPASVTDTSGLHGAAEGCDIVIHIAGIIAESRPDSTFQEVNVEGTRNVVAEAERAGVGRLIYASSLGADRGESDYHLSKREAERIVSRFRGGWVILRPGNVYGPGDEVVSLLLKMVRMLPAVPVIAGGEDRFQPIWVEDLACAIGEVAERTDLHGKTLELAGAEETSTNDLLDRFATITGRAPSRVPIPSFLATAGTAAADMVGVALPFNASQLTMLREGNVIAADSVNALTAVLGITPTPLHDGLKKLADCQPEQLPQDGVGSLERKRIWTDIAGSRLTPEELFERFRSDFNAMTPDHVDAKTEPGTSSTLQEGLTVTMSLPLRGNIQVRAVEVTDNMATLLTLEGHPLAGAVRFLSEQRGDQVRFEVQIYDRAATIVDWLTMNTVGGMLQDRTWKALIERMVRESGGSNPGGVEQEATKLDDEQAKLTENWLKDLVMARKRAASA